MDDLFKLNKINIHLFKRLYVKFAGLGLSRDVQDKLNVLADLIVSLETNDFIAYSKLEPRIPALVQSSKFYK